MLQYGSQYRLRVDEKGRRQADKDDIVVKESIYMTDRNKRAGRGIEDLVDEVLERRNSTAEKEKDDDIGRKTLK